MPSYVIVGYEQDGDVYCVECAPLPDCGDPCDAEWECPKCGCEEASGGDGLFACEGCGAEYKFDFDAVLEHEADCDDVCADCGDCLFCKGPCVEDAPAGRPRRKNPAGDDSDDDEEEDNESDDADGESDKDD